MKFFRSVISFFPPAICTLICDANHDLNIWSSLFITAICIVPLSPSNLGSTQHCFNPFSLSCSTGESASMRAFRIPMSFCICFFSSFPDTLCSLSLRASSCFKSFTCSVETGMLYIVYFPSDSFANAARSSLDFTERYPLYASLATN